MFTIIVNHNHANDEASCPRCGQTFKACRTSKKQLQPELQFYIHCIKECEEYKNSNLIANCPECSKLFLHDGAMHFTRAHRNLSDQVSSKSEWMTQAIYKSLRDFNTYAKLDLACPGCGKLFKAIKRKLQVF